MCAEFCLVNEVLSIKLNFEMTHKTGEGIWFGTVTEINYFLYWKLKQHGAFYIFSFG